MVRMILKIFNVQHVLDKSKRQKQTFVKKTYYNVEGYKNLILFRSSHRSCSVKKGVLGSFTKFTGKQLCQSLIFNKVAGLSPATFLKKRPWHRCFPVSFAKFLRTPFLQNTSGRLLLFVRLMMRLSYFLNQLIINTNLNVNIKE